MEKLLTPDQVKVLEDKDWEVKPKGNYITLYPSDFSSYHIWTEVCEQLGISTNTEQVDILYFGIIKS